MDVLTQDSNSSLASAAPTGGSPWNYRLDGMGIPVRSSIVWALTQSLPVGLVVLLAGGLASCGGGAKVQARNSADPAGQSVTVGVVQVVKKPLERNLTVSSELVPFQEIDVYAKESGYVRKLSVDYGSHVRAGQMMAVLEIPELEVQLRQDDATIRNATDMTTHAEHDSAASRRSTESCICRPKG